MKNLLATWKWSLGVITRSPLVLIALAALITAWGFGAYQWLYFPTESSGISLVVGVLWAVAQWAVLAVFLCVSVNSANLTASTGAASIRPHSLRGFSIHQLLRGAAFVALAALVLLLIEALFQLINHYSLEVASFLTFHKEQVVAPETVEHAFKVVEWLVRIVVIGFLAGFVSFIISQGWGRASRNLIRVLANACWRAGFPTTLLGFVVFGGLAFLLANWHPRVSPGVADYGQVIVRLGLALLLGVAGWLFWLLSTARLNLTAEEKPSA